jgi:hypothetical protein
MNKRISEVKRITRTLAELDDIDFKNFQVYTEKATKLFVVLNYYKWYRNFCEKVSDWVNEVDQTLFELDILNKDISSFLGRINLHELTESDKILKRKCDKLVEIQNKLVAMKELLNRMKP